MSTPVDTPDYYSKPYSWMIDHEVSHVKPEEDEVIVIQEKFKRVFFGQDNTEFARMANPEKRHGDANVRLWCINHNHRIIVQHDQRVTQSCHDTIGHVGGNNEINPCRHEDTLCLGQNWYTLANYNESILCQGTESRPIGGQCANCCWLLRNPR